MCLKYSYVPKVWKEGTGIFIPKPGKENYHEVFPDDHFNFLST